jgi:hypothetical protein
MCVCVRVCVCEFMCECAFDCKFAIEYAYVFLIFNMIIIMIKNYKNDDVIITATTTRIRRLSLYSRSLLIQDFILS